MKKLIFIAIGGLLFSACGSESEESNPNEINYRDEMRKFVIEISEYGKAERSPFFIIPQNGIELVTLDDDASGTVAIDYLKAIDGHGQESLHFGYYNDNEPTPDEDTEYLTEYLNLSHTRGKTILVTNYCTSQSYIDQSYANNENAGFVSFAANHRELDNIPVYPDPIIGENENTITQLSDIQNFLYLINPESFETKQDFIAAITATNYDLVIMDVFDVEGNAFTMDEIEQLRQKANSGKRLVIAYMSIGEAEDYRYYWNDDWLETPPVWMEAENPDWEGNFKVRYWEPEWKNLIFGKNDAYLDIILDAGFDGVYLDIIDAFDYFEER